MWVQTWQWGQVWEVCRVLGSKKEALTLLEEWDLGSSTQYSWVSKFEIGSDDYPNDVSRSLNISRYIKHVFCNAYYVLSVKTGSSKWSVFLKSVLIKHICIYFNQAYTHTEKYLARYIPKYYRVMKFQVILHIFLLWIIFLLYKYILYCET